MLGEGHELSPVGLSCLDAVKERAILQVTAVFIVKSQKIVLVVLATDIPLCDGDAAQGRKGGRSLSGMGNEYRERKCSPRLVSLLLQAQQGRAEAASASGARPLK